MTSSANDEWDHGKLTRAIKHFNYERISNRIDGYPKYVMEDIQHAIDFIEYNMREMEITGGNGD